MHKLTLEQILMYYYLIKYIENYYIVHYSYQQFNQPGTPTPIFSYNGTP